MQNWSNGILLEIHSVLSGMRRNTKWKRIITANIQLNGILPTILTSPSSHTQPQPVNASLSNLSSTTPQMSKEEFILQAFNKLKQTVEHAKSLAEISAVEVVDPFLLVITFPETTGPITGYSLASIERLLRLGIFDSCSNGYEAISNVIYSVTHCKFEATDSASDEVVLLRILEILKLTIQSRFGTRITDELVCGLIECAFSMCFQMRLSHCLRKFAEVVIVDCVCHVVDSISSSTTSTGGGRASSALLQVAAPSIHNTTEIATTPSLLKLDNLSLTSPSVPGAATEEGFVHVATTAPVEPIPSDALPSTTSSQNQPFGLPTIRELLRFISTLLDPHDQHNTDSMRSIALNVFLVLVEKGVDILAQHRFLLDSLSLSLSNLLQLIKVSQTNGNLLLLNPAIQLANAIFSSTMLQTKFRRHYEAYLERVLMDALWDEVAYVFQPSEDFASVDYEKFLDVAGNVLKCQGEAQQQRDVLDALFQRKKQLTYKLPNSGKFPYLVEEMSQVYWEAVYHLVRSDSFMYAAFINYDCDLGSNDVLRDLILLLCNNLLNKNLNHDVIFHLNYAASDQSMSLEAAYEEQVKIMQQQPRTFNVGVPIALDLLTLLLSQLLRRVSTHGYELSPRCETNETVNVTFISQLKEKKKRKADLLRVSVLFNRSPEEAIQTMAKEGIIPSTDAKHVGRILHDIPKLDKRNLGEYLGKPKSVSVLQEFFNVFEWSCGSDGDGLRIDEALRIVLRKFRLPGESQQIQRVVEAFATGYFEKVVQKSKSFVEEMESKERDIQSPDSVFVLAYAIIILNTDQHNPQVRKRMAKQEFIRNLRGTNDNFDFPLAYLSDIYDGIKLNEIVMLEERKSDGIVVVDLTGDDSDSSNSSIKVHGLDDKTCIDVDIEIFKQHRPYIQPCLFYTITTCSDDDLLLLSKSVTVYYQLCNLAYFYGESDILAELILSLVALNPPPLRLKQQSSSSPSLMLVKSLKDSYKCQLLNIILFRIVNEFGNLIKSGAVWKAVFDLIFVFSDANLVLFHTSDHCGAEILFPKIQPSLSMATLQETEKQQAMESVGGGGGIFSAISSFLLSSASYSSSGSAYSAVPPAPSVKVKGVIDKELIDYEAESLDDALKDIVDEFKIDQLLKENVRYFDMEAIISCLFSCIDDESRDKNITLWHNRVLFGLLMSSKLIKSTQNFDLVTMHVEQVVQNILLQPQRHHFITVKYGFSSLLDLTLFSTTSQDKHGRLEPVTMDCLDSLDKVLIYLQSSTADFAPVYSVHGLFNVGFAQAVSSFVFDGLFHLHQALSISMKDSHLVALRLSEVAKGAILRMKTHLGRDNESAAVKVLEKIRDLFRAILPGVDYLGGVELTLCLLKQYSIVVVAEAQQQQDVSVTVTASQIVNKLSLPPQQSSPLASNGLSSNSLPIVESPFLVLFREVAVECCQLLHERIELIPPAPVSIASKVIPATPASLAPENVAWWNDYWMPTLNAICEATCHPCKEVRTVSMTLLQKACLNVKLEMFVERVFMEILFPHLRSIGVDSSSSGFRMEDVKVRASTLLCKLFLHHVHSFDEASLRVIWMGILDIQKLFYINASLAVNGNLNSSNETLAANGNLNASHGSGLKKGGDLLLADSYSLIELIPESIKNMILVMASSGIFHHASDDDEQGKEGKRKWNDLYGASWAHLDEWLPGVRAEVDE